MVCLDHRVMFMDYHECAVMHEVSECVRRENM